MNFFGRIKLGVAGAEPGSLKAKNEKIGSLRLGRYCSKAGGRDIFLLNTGIDCEVKKSCSTQYVSMWATFPSIDLFGYVMLSGYPFHGKKSIRTLVENSVCHRSRRKWSECRYATAVSQVTPLAESIEMVQQ